MNTAIVRDGVIPLRFMTLALNKRSNLTRRRVGSNLYSIQRKDETMNSKGWHNEEGVQCTVCGSESEHTHGQNEEHFYGDDVEAGQ